MRISSSSSVLLSVGVLAALAVLLVASTGPATEPPASQPATQPVEVVYIMSPNCEKCKLAGPIVEAATAKLAGRAKLTKLNVLDVDDLDRVLDLEDRLKLPAAPPPRAIVGTRCLTGLDEIRQKIDQALAEQAPPAASQPGQ